MEVVDPEPEGRSEEDRNIWDRLRTLYGESVPNDMTEYSSVDYNAETAPLLDDVQTIAMVPSGSDIDDVESIGPSFNVTDIADENEGQGDVVEETVKLSDALSALRTLRLYGLQKCAELEPIGDQIEAVLLRQSVKMATQSKITSLEAGTFQALNIQYMFQYLLMSTQCVLKIH